ncbi:DEAD/DEAH box helicase [Gammaproteobacteria bacterium]|nr:DEAD/DEAH box helicase [Gammaproteobacteria bacterium]
MNLYTPLEVLIVFASVIVFSMLLKFSISKIRRSGGRKSKTIDRKNVKRRKRATKVKKETPVNQSSKKQTPKKDSVTSSSVKAINSDAVTDIRFDSLGLQEILLEGVKDAGFEFCTPIQAKSLPALLLGRDVAGQAQTGTGKTAAYLLATMNTILLGDERVEWAIGGFAPRGIILAPTRELAIQIHQDALTLGRHSGLSLGLIYGGVDYDKQRKILEGGVDIIIGTPGRIIDFFKQEVFSLDKIQALVLDEADRMFDLGFIKDIRFLLRRMPQPEKRLNMLYSATLSHRVNELGYEYMNTPELVEVLALAPTADKVTQLLYHVSSDEKIRLLIGLFRQHEPKRAIVFANTKRVVALVVSYLNSNGYRARALSGDVEQSKRQRLIGDFKSGAVSIVVATDVAARGLHIPDVSHVFNFDLPHNCEDYVHRIGRTARAGESGEAISFACEEYVFSLESIESYVENKIPVDPVTENLLPKVTKPPYDETRASSDRRKPRRRSPGT